jgi:glycosyltransferase involved in cell wall biosynthesis
MDSVERYYRIVDWHIAVAPLADTVFNHSKSDLRVLEAAMLGIPSVASARDSYGRFIEHGVDGMLVHKPAEWAEHLNYLASDPTARERMGQRARAKAMTRTVEATALNWIKAYEA